MLWISSQFNELTILFSTDISAGRMYYSQSCKYHSTSCCKIAKCCSCESINKTSSNHFLSILTTVYLDGV